MSAEITPEYRDALRALSGEAKLRSAFQLYWSARKLKASYLRRKHPSWSVAEIDEEVKRVFSNASS